MSDGRHGTLGPDNLGGWKPEWIVHSFTDLEHFRDVSMLDTDELGNHGVYLIVRRVLPRGARLSSEKSFKEWLSRQLSLPNGDLTAEISRHYARGTLRLQLGLSSSAEEVAEPLLAQAGDKWIRKAIRGIVAQLPPVVLYCGETHSFATRIREHLDGSEAWNRLVAAGYEPKDLEFHALPMPDVDDRMSPATVMLRRSVERFFAQVLLAPFTVRPG